MPKFSMGPSFSAIEKHHFRHSFRAQCVFFSYEFFEFSVHSAKTLSTRGFFYYFCWTPCMRVGLSEKQRKTASALITQTT